MTECVQALYTFFSSFGLPAYGEGEVPTYDAQKREVKPPYITVQQISPSWRASVPFYARVWYRDSSNTAIDAKVDEIAEAIGEGVSIPTPGGAIYISQNDNFAQHQSSPGDPRLKCVYLSMILQAHC